MFLLYKICWVETNMTTEDNNSLSVLSGSVCSVVLTCSVSVRVEHETQKSAFFIYTDSIITLKHLSSSSLLFLRMSLYFSCLVKQWNVETAGWWAWMSLMSQIWFKHINTIFLWQNKECSFSCWTFLSSESLSRMQTSSLHCVTGGGFSCKMLTANIPLLAS